MAGDEDNYLELIKKRLTGQRVSPTMLYSYTQPKSPREVISGASDRLGSLQDVIAKTFGTTSSQTSVPGIPKRSIEDANLSTDSINKIGQPLSKGLLPRSPMHSSRPLTSPQEMNRFTTLSGLQQRLSPGDVVADEQIDGIDPDALADLEAKIMGLATPVTTPDRWVSPYSQGYLNQLGDRITQSGISAREQLAAAKQDILDNYQMGLDTRAAENQSFTNELSKNASNIGVNYKDSTFGQRAATDAAFLDQMAQQNQATDLSYNDKLGQLFANVAANLGSAAREGLLTPKQFIPGSTELPAGAREQIDFLKEKYRGLLDEDAAAKEAAREAELAGLPDIEQVVTEDIEQINPLYPDAITSISNAYLRDFVQNIYDEAKGNIPAALSILSSRIQNPGIRFAPDGSPLTEGTTPEIPTIGPGGIRGFLGDVRSRAEEEILKTQQQALFARAQEILRSISPTYLGVPTGRTITSKSKSDYM